LLAQVEGMAIAGAEGTIETGTKGTVLARVDTQKRGFTNRTHSGCYRG